MSIATYKRPDGLRKLLESCMKQTSVELHIVVVDNDVKGSAADVARDFPEITYVIEPMPGIAAARNRGLQECLGLPVDWVAFVDDDEHLDEDWGDELASFVSTHDVDVVSGPVIPVFRSDAPAWVVRGGFFERPRMESGSSVNGAATNNALVRIEALELLKGAHFSEEWSQTGGSDGEFFQRLHSTNARFRYCNEALVYEDVPASRTSARWVYHRGVRLGNVSARLKMANGWSSSRIALVGICRVALALPLAILAVLRGKLVAPAVMHFPKGVGMLRALRGNYYREYART